MRACRRIIALALASLVVSACASGIQKVTDPSRPLERPTYSILPPSGDGWQYMSREQVGRFELSFGKRPTSPTHTFIAAVTETNSRATFTNPSEFLAFIRQATKVDTDPRRLTVLAEQIELDNRFGAYSIRKFIEAEDRTAVNAPRGSSLVMRVQGEVFVHPHFPNVIITIDFSERGRRDELDPAFEARATRFVDGLRLKRP